jgi:hypothetical protein
VNNSRIYGLSSTIRIVIIGFFPFLVVRWVSCVFCVYHQWYHRWYWIIGSCELSWNDCIKQGTSGSVNLCIRCFLQQPVKTKMHLLL